MTLSDKTLDQALDLTTEAVDVGHLNFCSPPNGYPVDILTEFLVIHFLRFALFSYVFSYHAALRWWQAAGIMALAFGVALGALIFGGAAPAGVVFQEPCLGLFASRAVYPLGVGFHPFIHIRWPFRLAHIPLSFG